jgi:hypothetical protein
MQNNLKIRRFSAICFSSEKLAETPRNKGGWLEKILLLRYFAIATKVELSTRAKFFGGRLREILAIV